MRGIHVMRLIHAMRVIHVMRAIHIISLVVETVGRTLLADQCSRVLVR